MCLCCSTPLYVHAVRVHDFDPDADPGRYLYLKVADHIEARIRAGVLKRGDRLPAERDLAEEYSVSLGTARKATNELRTRELVTTTASLGTFVVRAPD